MSLYLRGNIWWIDVTLADGSRVRESTCLSDKEQAIEYKNVRKNQLIVDLSAVKPTFNAAVARWAKEKSHKKSLDRDIDIAMWLAKDWGDKLLHSITDEDITSVLDVKASQTSKGNANHYLSFIRSLFNQAAGWGWVNRVIKVKPYRKPPTSIRFLSKDETSKLLEELPQHLSLMAEFSILTGLRQSNVTGLKWVNINLDQKILWVDADEHKNGKMHGIPLNVRAIEILESLKGSHPDYVFTYRNQPIGNPNNSAWKKALTRAGIHNFRWHDLRHTFASNHALNGTPMLTLKDLGGWKSLDMVNRYAHLSTEGTKQWADNSSTN